MAFRQAGGTRKRCAENLITALTGRNTQDDLEKILAFGAYVRCRRFYADRLCGIQRHA